MRRGLYLRLAVQNLRRNSQIYLPFIAASALMSFVIYIVATFALSPGFGQNLPYGSAMRSLMMAGLLVMPVICAPFLWYINGFLIKRRKTELGLYGVLGMGRRNVAVVMALESLCCLAVSLAAGLLSGTVLGRMMYLLLLNLTNLPVDMDYGLHWAPVVYTMQMFAAIFDVSLIYNLFQVSLAHPISLLGEERRGERDSRLAPLWAVAGTLCLGGGYLLSLGARPDNKLPLLFFLAVLLVIAGTYGVFTALSVYVLKALRGTKVFYYQCTHFISVSGMLHRMRKNAAGLANICLFSTMVLVSLAGALSVFAGQQDVLRRIRAAEEVAGSPIRFSIHDLELVRVTFGTLMFMGLFFACIFFVCTALIMYYKQVTEGYEDRARFEVMRQVGLDETLVRRTVGRQILMVFFIPLAGALVHTAFALPMVIRLLGLLWVDDVGMILGCFGSAALVFALLYLLTYFITAKTYYRLVR